MTSAAKFIDDPALRKALEAKDEGSSDRGSIGTEATRAGILEKLAANTGLISIEKEKGYSELVWKTTKQGQEFCAALPPEITKPDISALWAEKQSQIKAGELTVEEFIKENDEYVQGLIDELDRNGISISSNATPCPVCNNGFLRKRKGQNGFSGDAPATLNARQHSRTKTANRIWKQNPDQKVPCPGSKPPALHAVKKLLSGLKAFSVPGASLKSGLKCQEKTDTKSG